MNFGFYSFVILITKIIWWTIFIVRNELKYLGINKKLDKLYDTYKMQGNIENVNFISIWCNPTKLSNNFLLIPGLFRNYTIYKSKSRKEYIINGY